MSRLMSALGRLRARLAAAWQHRPRKLRPGPALPHLYVALVLGLAAAPALIGWYCERFVARQLEGLAASGFRVAEHHWQRGWFTAEGLTVLLSPGPSGSPRLRLSTTLIQGPRWDDLAAGALSLARGQTRVTVLDAPRPLPPLRIAFRLGPDGAPSARFSLPDVTYSGGLGQLQLSDGYVDLSADTGSHIDGNGRLGALQGSGADGAVAGISNIDWRLALDLADDGLPRGDLLLTLGRLRLSAAPAGPERTDAPRAALEAAGVRLGLSLARGPRPSAAGTGDQPERLDLTAALELDWLRINGIDLAPARLVFALTDLDPSALVALRDGWQAIAARGLSPSVRGLAQGELLLQQLPALLASEPRLHGEPLELRTPDGTVSARLLLGLAVPPPGSQQAVGGTFWLHQLVGEADVALPQPLVRRWLLERGRERAAGELARLGADPLALPPDLEADLVAAADAALAALLRERWLVPSAGRYTARALIGDGLLTINGRTLPITR